MSDEMIFVIANNSVLPGWLLLILAPRSIWTRRLLDYGLYPVLLGTSYGLLLLLDVPGPQGASFSSLEGVTRIFTTPKTIIAAWIHYLVFDLFVGTWIVRDAQRHDIGHVWTLPCLLGTLMFGPLGLLSWLLIRTVHLRRVTVID
jgi:hypothetical protein